jgi:Domain of unknown function (DUF4169)
MTKFRLRVGAFRNDVYALLNAELKRIRLPSRITVVAEVINLRTVRKRAERQKRNQSANANRLAFGQPKHVRKLEDAQQAKVTRDLDRHRIETGDHR